ncbi:MAG: TonB-dependent receptor [Candidatus Marinimicrobia bacterium]|nr:TonB-dependent receptor [Candidatus Neomarinimicrobiota bacterium]
MKLKIQVMICLMIFLIVNMEAQSLKQRIRGTVVDQESQMPLPGANITIEKTTLGAMTDNKGNFAISDVPVGRYNIMVSYIGYKNAVMREILVQSAKESVLNIELEESPIMMNEIVVETEIHKEQTLNSMSSVSARSFTVEESRRYAGGFDDPARLASAFAGVSVGNIQDNAIIVRGNAPKGILWQVEGVKVPNPNHFPDGNVAGGGFMSILSAQLLSDSDFFTGAFPAEYGEALSGVFDIKMRNGNDQKREHTFQMGILGIDFATEGPVGNQGASYLVNYRYSTFALLVPFLNTEQIPMYQDLSFKVNIPTRKYGLFSIWSISSADKNIEPAEKDSSKWEFSWDRVKYNYKVKMGAFGLNHKYLLGASSYINTSLAATGLSNKFDMDRYDDNWILQDQDYLNNLTGTYVVKSYVNHKFNSNHVNRTGISMSNLFYNIDVRSSFDFTPPMQIVSKSRGNSNLVEVFSQSKYHLTQNLIVNGGVHSQYFMFNKTYTIEPRVGINWKIFSNQTLSFGYGNHSQLNPLFIYFSERNGEKINRDLEFAKAHHLVFGYDCLLNANLRLKIEPYYQYLYNFPVIPDSSYSLINYEQDWQLHDKLENDGTGKNFGIDFTLERFLQNNFYYMVTASIFDSKYVGGDDVERNTRFNAGYTVNLLFGKEIFLGNSKNNVLGINGKFTAQGGRYRTPVDHEKTIATRELYYDASRAFSKREKPVNYLDISLTYRKNRRKFSSTWALQIKNALGVETIYEEDFNYQKGKITENKDRIIVPSLSYKIDF